MRLERGVKIFNKTKNPTRPPTCHYRLKCSIFIVKVHIIGNSLCEKVFKYINREQLIVKNLIIYNIYSYCQYYAHIGKLAFLSVPITEYISS